MLLEEAGYEVTIFEARNRLGGRLFSIAKSDGVLYEAGGEWIDADHHRVLDLIRYLGSEPNPLGQWPRKLIFRGREASEDVVWTEALEDDLRIEAIAREMARDLHSPISSNHQANDFDQLSVAEFFEQNTVSETGKWWLNAKARLQIGDDLNDASLLGWLLGVKQRADRDGDESGAYRIPGGASDLCEKMASKLQGDREMGCVLKRIRQHNNQTELVFNHGTFTFDKVVLTVPPPALERIVFEPALSVNKRCAVEACRMGRAVKIVWQFEKAWWRDYGWGGGMLCDGPIQSTWDSGLGEAPLLTAYVCGKEASEWVGLGDPIRAGLYELSVLFPEAQLNYVRGWFHEWVFDPFARGGISRLAPGYVTEHMQFIGPNESGIHFAGEHTSSWVGTIEGALESAERVCAEIFEKDQRSL